MTAEAVHGTDHRTCESCGAAMPGRMHRSRDEQGRRVCEQCKSNPQAGWTTTHSSLSVVDQQEMRRREAEAITSVVRVRKAKHAGLTMVAHDSGDQGIIHHCFSCGSGAVVGRSDGTTECEFCHTTFTVQVQPQHPFMPQTVDGTDSPPPGMPGATPEPTELSAPVDPTVEEGEEGVAPDALGDADPNPPSHPNGPGQPITPKEQPSPLGPDGDPQADADHQPMPESEDGDHEPAPGGKAKPKKPGGNKPPWMKGSAKTGAWGLYVTYRGGHVDLYPWARFANEEDAAKASEFLAASMRGQRTDPNMGAVAVKSYPSDAANTTFEEFWPAGLKKPEGWAKQSRKQAATEPLCVDHFTEAYGFEPDMGIEGVTFEPGICGRCGRDAIVFTLDSFFTAEGHRLSGDDYMARLALAFADDREAVLDTVRAANTAAMPPFSSALSDGLTKVKIKAADLRVGDRLDITGKTRVSLVHPKPPEGQVLCQTQTTGTRSPSVLRLSVDDNMTVWRKGE